MVRPASEINWDKPYGNKEIRKNQLAAIELDTSSPEWIPCSVGMFPYVWKKYRDALKELVLAHPFIFGKNPHIPGDYDYIDSYHRVGEKTDNWDCGWQMAKEGYEGVVVKNPLADWSAFKTFNPKAKADPLQYNERGPRNMLSFAIGNYNAGLQGLMRSADGGRLFDQLYFLRGFANLMSDIARDHPMLPKLIQMLQDVRTAQLDQYYEIVHEQPDEHFIDIVSFHTDIGTQDRLMISPLKFRKYIKPLYAALFQRCRKEGSHVYLSSDGNLLSIVDDLIECGVSVHDPQERANTIPGIKKAYKRKMCVDLDLDRQIFPFATPEQLDRQIKRAVEELNGPNGGLMMKAEISDDNVPLENIEAICNAFEKYCITRK
nr:uroporphyrinogen decarboxylase family protein [Candidatus Sigynarchaeota archaeon]